MIAKPNIIIIHGTTGCPEENWYPWLKEEVHALGWDASVPTFPTPEGQSLGTWKAAFNKQLGSVRPNMILIGHSIGTAFILNLLEESAEPVTATYMVAGFIGKLGLEEFDGLNESFTCRQFRWKKIRENLGCGRIFHADNDPYVPLAKACELSEKLNVPITMMRGAKHINEAAGYKTFPLILEQLKLDLSNKTAARS
jgi:predicted alpha/beta hydrolase family esterase